MPKIQMRRDTAANWKSVNPTLLAGEWALETDTRLMKIGDGTTAYNALPYSTAEDSDEWQKPADWIDMRSGALSNSVYFLVGHSADYSKYNLFGLQASVSSSGTYDVYIDGIKKYTTDNGQDTMINWQTLALSSGWDVTYPEALRTHIVRVTPSLSTNSITGIKHRYVDNEESGTLWVHFNINNAISLADFARTQFSSTDGNGYVRILEAVTSNKDTLVVSSLNSAFQGCYGLKSVPTFEGNNMNTKSGARAFSACKSLNLINLKNILLTSDQVFWNATKLKKINCENAFVVDNGYIFAGCENLTKLATISSTGASSDYFLQGCSNLQDTFLDFSQNANKTLINLRATSSSRIDGLKGITVCPEAPFTGASPQINVSYTGLDRQALVNLFKSMPTVSAGQVCNITGTTGASALTAEDLAIATDKGWTITR